MPLLGYEAETSHNTGVWATPVWDGVGLIQDTLELNLEKGEADVTTRAGNGWRQRIGTLKDGSVQFQMLWEAADADFAAFRDAWLNDTLIDCAVMDQDITVSGAQGLRAEMTVLNFSRSEPLDGALTSSVNVAPGASSNAPVWMIVP